jgi:hypothetical protein
MTKLIVAFCNFANASNDGQIVINPSSIKFSENLLSSS